MTQAYLSARDAALIAAAADKLRRGRAVEARPLLAMLGSKFAREVARRVLAKDFGGVSSAAATARELYGWSEPK